MRQRLVWRIGFKHGGLPRAYGKLFVVFGGVNAVLDHGMERGSRFGDNRRSR